MIARRRRDRGGISLFSEEKMNYKNDTGDEMDLDYAGDDKNSLQLWESEDREKIQATQVVYTL